MPDRSLPELDYVEIEITEFCNLNCRGCCNFSNLAKEKKFYEYEEYARDMERLTELFGNIKKIRLMGGEPLLNPRVSDYAAKARELFPDSDIRIVTNGMLLLSFDETKLAEIRNADVKFDISNYPPTRKIKDKLGAKLSAAGMNYDFGIPMDFFFKNIRKDPSDDPGPAYRNCIFTHCHSLGHGKLAPCSYAYCISRFNAEYGTDYPENDWFDIYADITGEAIIEAFSRPHEFCRCCGKGIVPVKWKGGVRSKDARPQDWQIADTFLNTKIIPAVHSLVKPFAVKLRHSIQDK